MAEVAQRHSHEHFSTVHHDLDLVECSGNSFSVAEPGL